MRQKGFVFEVGELVKDQQGTSVSFDINEKVTFNIEDHPVVSPLKAKVTFMKIGGGIHVLVKDLEVSFASTCMKCTDSFVLTMHIPMAERVYFFEKERGDPDVFDLYYVEMKAFTIDLTEFLRQEIILHFPMIPVCSKSCFGLCPVCGKNLNKNQCSCEKKADESKPLAILKELYQQSK